MSAEIGLAMHTVVMDEDVVRAAVNLDRNVACEDTWDHNPRSLRHQAYRQFVYHVAGTTGLRRRLIVPSCIVWAIRNKWPDPDGVYMGNKSVVLIWTVESDLKVFRGASAATADSVSVDSDSSSDSDSTCSS